MAEAAGLSHQAPYRHFDSKEDLLAALVEAGFTDLLDRMRTGAESAGTPREALAALALAYMRFALEAPYQFRLMFQRELVDISRFPGAAAASADAFSALLAGVRALVADDLAAERAIAAWSLVHGYSTLLLELSFEAETHLEDRARLFAHLI